MLALDIHFQHFGTDLWRDGAFVADVAKNNLTAIFQQDGQENIRSL
jgi:hypothetical protein